MKKSVLLFLLVSASGISFPAYAQTSQSRIPLCLVYPDDNRYVPCTGVVPVDKDTGNPMNWSDVFSNVSSGSGGGTSYTVTSGSSSSKATPVQNTDGSKLATENTLGTLFKPGQLIGNTSFASTQSGSWNVTLLSGTSNIGTIGNTAFGINGSLPAGTNAIGSVSVSNFPTTQSVTGSVSVTNSSIPVTGNFYQTTQPVSISSTVSTDISQINTSAIATGSGSSNAGTQRVVLSSDSTVGISGNVTANIGSTNGLALDTTVNSLLKAGQSVNIGNFPSVQNVSGTLTTNIQASVTTSSPNYSNNTQASLSLTPVGALRVDGSAVTQPISGNIAVTNFPNTQNVSGTVTANLGTLNGAATDASLQSLKTALGSPFQTNGSIGNSYFGARLQDNTGTAFGTSSNPIYVSGTTGGGGSTPTGSAGSPNSSVVTVQGISGGTSLPVSGTITANVGATNGLALDTTVGGLLKAGQSINVGNFPTSQSVTQGTTPWIVSGQSSDGNAPVNPSIHISGLDDNGKKRPLHTDANGNLQTIVTNFPTTQSVSGTVNVGTIPSITISSSALPTNAATSDNQNTQISTMQAIQSSTATSAGSIGSRNSTAPTTAQTIQGVDSNNVGRGLLLSSAGVLAAPTAGVSQSNGTVTAIAANTSTTVCPATTNPVVFEVQIYGTSPVLLGLDGQALSAITPSAGSGAYILLPTQYALYSGPVARTNAITAYSTTAQTITCNITLRQ